MLRNRQVRCIHKWDTRLMRKQSDFLCQQSLADALVQYDSDSHLLGRNDLRTHPVRQQEGYRFAVILDWIENGDPISRQRNGSSEKMGFR